MTAPIAVDAMGGDDAPEVVVAGAIAASEEGIAVVLVGHKDRLAPFLRKAPAIPVVHAEHAVGMGDAAAGVRRTEGSSLRVALRLVRDRQAAAMVSCGNTGAVLIAAVLDLGVVDGIDRPAIATILPRSDGGRLVLLDAGANVDCKPEQLVSFAHLGASYATVLGMRTPRVGLLANGSEDGKGNAQARATLPLLRQSGLHVVGNIEPSAAMAGACDVLVTDGFVGNILLKAAEGAVNTVVNLLREEIRGRPHGMLGAWLLKGAFRRFRERVAWDAHGGAVLLGVRGPVVVGHGKANREAVRQAIRMAARAAREGLVDSVTAGLRKPDPT